MVAIEYCVVVYGVVAPFQLETRRWEAGGRDIVVEADGSAAPRPDVEQRDVIPPVPPGAAQGNELLVLEDETDLLGNCGNCDYSQLERSLFDGRTFLLLSKSRLYSRILQNSPVNGSSL